MFFVKLSLPEIPALLTDGDYKMTKISFTVYTKPKPGIMTKYISLVNNKLDKNSTQCALSEGTAQTITLPFDQLASLLDRVEQNQAISWGVCCHEQTKIVSRKKEDSTPDAISRTRDNFNFPVKVPGSFLGLSWATVTRAYRRLS